MLGVYRFVDGGSLVSLFEIEEKVESAAGKQHQYHHDAEQWAYFSGLWSIRDTLHAASIEPPRISGVVLVCG